MTGQRVGRHGELVPVRGFSRGPRHIDDMVNGSVWWSHDGLQVISSLTVAWLNGTHETLKGPHWQMSVARRSAADGRPSRETRPTQADVLRAVDAFGLPAFDVDNHHPGVAVHLWCPLDEQYRSECECKQTEMLITEPDGYQWTNPTDGECRGCELERLIGLPCTVHQSDVTEAPIISPPDSS